VPHVPKTVPTYPQSQPHSALRPPGSGPFVPGTPEGCGEAAGAVPGRRPPALFRNDATVEFEVADALVQAGFPLPRPGTRLVTQEDFPMIIQKTQEANADTFGAGADAP